MSRDGALVEQRTAPKSHEEVSSNMESRQRIDPIKGKVKSSEEAIANIYEAAVIGLELLRLSALTGNKDAVPRMQMLARLSIISAGDVEMFDPHTGRSARERGRHAKS